MHGVPTTHAVPPRPRPARRAARTLFPVAAQLLAAESDLDRMGLLLRISDALIIKQSRALRQACMSAGFKMGCDFLDVREASLHANRDRQGHLPAEFQRSLQIWCNGFVALSQERSDG